MKNLLVIAIALPLALSSMIGCAHPYYPPPAYAPPPPNAIARRGFDDGVAAAHRDFAQGRPPNYSRHSQFRYPPVPPGQPVAIYRDNFHRGYNRTYRRRR